MLFNKILPDGKKRSVQKPLLIKPRDGYVRPKIDFKTSTSIWNVDEIIKRRNRDWRRLTDEDGHTGERAEKFRKDHDSIYTGTYSVFPIPLMEYIIIRYAGEPGSKILDAFAGGPPRAITASIMGHEYHGVDVRQGQIDENVEVVERLDLKNIHYYLDDARYLNIPVSGFDCAITCPPYYNLEVYSDQEDDISTLGDYLDFDFCMQQCAEAHREKMKPGSYVCIVVGNFRDKATEEVVDFRSHTVENFRLAGFLFWQDIILSKNFGSAAKRSGNAWKGHKLVPRHEHLLVFKTPEEPKTKKRVRL